MPSINEWLQGSTTAGEPLPLEKVNAYRARRELPPLFKVADLDGASHGIGDSITKIARRTRLARPGAWILMTVLGWSACDCERRRRTLNRQVPYPQARRNGFLRWSRRWI